MEEKDKITKLNDEIAQSQTQRVAVEAKISTLNKTISDLQNQDARLTGERANLRQEFQTLKERPHENLEQLLKTQDGIAAADRAIAKTQEDMEATTGQYRATIREGVELDNKIQGLQGQVERTLKIDELKSDIAERVNDGVEALKENAPHLAAAAVHAAMTYHEVHDGVPNLEVLRNTLAGELAVHAVHGQDALIANADAMMANAKAKVTEFANSAGASPDHAELQNIEHEIAKHNDHADELDTLAKEFEQNVERQKEEDRRDDIDVADQKKAIRGEFELAAEKANKMFERQDKEMSELQEHAAQDPNVRTAQTQVRETMAEEMNAKRDEVTRELCRPVAEINVDDRNARTLEDSAGLNKAHLERYQTKVANEPDGKERIERFASNLDQSQKDLEKQLLTERPQAVNNEITSLQHDHFPQIQSPSLQGPELSQAAPQQPGPGGGGAPQQQQQGPAAPGM